VVGDANQLADFPPEQFTILVFCEGCGRQVALDRSKVPPGTGVQDLPRRLRCAVCGTKAAAIRIAYTGAGGFRVSSAMEATRD
jgi:rubredoxin